MGYGFRKRKWVVMGTEASKAGDVRERFLVARMPRRQN